MTRERLTARTRWTVWFIFCNGVFAAVLGLRYLPWIDIPDSLTGAYVALIYLGQFPLMAWLAGLPLMLLAALSPGRKTLSIMAAIYAAAALGILGLDTVAYDLYRFHLNSFVLEMVLQGGTQVFAFSWQTWLSAATLFATIVLLELALGWLLWRKLPSGRWMALAFTSMLAAQLTVHSWHAWADANYDTRLTSVTRHVPLYYAATAKRLMNEHGLVDQQNLREGQRPVLLRDTRSDGQLNYPISSLQCQPPESTLNLLMIVIDGMRWDMLDPRWMPNTHEFAGQSLNFLNHYSNGNATKPGIFTLFYGLPSGYWDAFTAAKRPPVLITRMQSLNYATTVLGSATLISPAFDQNVFASIPDLRLETPGEQPWDRDIQITDDWLKFAEHHATTNPEQPFFGFLFYDTPHNHQVPDDYPVKFQPYWESVNKLSLDQEFDPELIRNNYKSTLHFVDNQIRRVLQDLHNRNLLESTIVLITGDHGQEFNEYNLNYWGHGSNFGQYQLRVPMVVRWPGKDSAIISHRTENFDVVPTLMQDMLGCSQTDPEVYASGNGLLKPMDKIWTLAHSYMGYALLMKDFQMVKDPSGDVDMLDQHLRPNKEFNVPGEVSRQVFRELSRFYK